MKNVIILGSGRSGTSMVAGLFRHSGARLGADLLPPTASNPFGYYEDREINAINDELIAAMVRWPLADGLRRRFTRGPSRSVASYWLVAPARLRAVIPTPSLRARMEAVTAATPFCYKDPRFSTTLPLWRPFLPANAVFVVVFREPSLVVDSVLRDAREYQPPLQLERRHLWRSYRRMYRRLLHEWADEGRWLFLHYDDVVDGRALSAIERFTGATLDTTELDRTVSRAKPTAVVEGRPARRARATYQELESRSRRDLARWTAMPAGSGPMLLAGDTSERVIDEAVAAWAPPSGGTAAAATGLVFSCDRPLQLHGLLSSYFASVHHSAPLWVLYRASSPRFERAYCDVFQEFGERGATPVPETMFRSDLLRLLETVPTSRLFFLVDDIVFIDDLDLRAFAAGDPRCEVPSMRLAPSIRYSYAMDKSMPPPADLTPIAGGRFTWNWSTGALGWGYPHSLDGNLFWTPEILGIARAASFAAPNTFEAALGIHGARLKARRGVCYERPKIINIACNRVQAEHPNRAGAGADPGLLLQRWEAGWRMNVHRLRSFAAESCHVDIDLPLVRR